MEAYRDQYATLFNQGRNVVVIGISVDPDTTLAAWAREQDTPLLFASDPVGAAGKLYGAWDEKRQLDGRVLFVIAPDGRVAYRTPSFRVTTEQAYIDLGTVVDSLAPAPAKADSR
jgi:peroxiredoxin